MPWTTIDSTLNVENSGHVPFLLTVAEEFFSSLFACFALASAAKHLRMTAATSSCHKYPTLSANVVKISKLSHQ